MIAVSPWDSRPPPWRPTCAGATTQHWFSIARARSSGSQWWGPVKAVKAAGTNSTSRPGERQPAVQFGKAQVVADRQAQPAQRRPDDDRLVPGLHRARLLQHGRPRGCRCRTGASCGSRPGSGPGVRSAPTCCGSAGCAAPAPGSSPAAGSGPAAGPRRAWSGPARRRGPACTGPGCPPVAGRRSSRAARRGSPPRRRPRGPAVSPVPGCAGRRRWRSSAPRRRSNACGFRPRGGSSSLRGPQFSPGHPGTRRARAPVPGGATHLGEEARRSAASRRAGRTVRDGPAGA